MDNEWNVKKIRAAIREGRVNERGVDNSTPLHLATSRGKTDVVQELITAGADVEAKDKSGLSPIGLAVSSGHLPAVELLLAAGANPDAQCSPLYLAVVVKNEAKAALLVRSLLGAGADPNARNPSYRGRTPLWRAMQKRDETIALDLLAAGADPTARDEEDYTVLHMAACHGHVKAARRIIKAPRVKIDARDHKGGTALLQAAFHGHATIVRLLLGAGADPNAATDDKRSPLMKACEGHTQKGGSLECVRHLVSAGANLAARDVDGDTALDHAVLSKSADIVTFLISRRASARSAIPWSVAPPARIGLLKQLVEAGGDVDAMDKQGNTALHYAASLGERNIISYLVAKGASTRAKNKKKLTPLDVLGSAWSGAKRKRINKNNELRSVLAD